MKIQCYKFHLITINFLSSMQITSNVVLTYRSVYEYFHDVFTVILMPSVQLTKILIKMNNSP